MRLTRILSQGICVLGLCGMAASASAIGSSRGARRGTEHRALQVRVFRGLVRAIVPRAETPEKRAATFSARRELNDALKGVLRQASGGELRYLEKILEKPEAPAMLMTDRIAGHKRDTVVSVHVLGNGLTASIDLQHPRIALQWSRSAIDEQLPSLRYAANAQRVTNGHGLILGQTEPVWIGPFRYSAELRRSRAEKSRPIRDLTLGPDDVEVWFDRPHWEGTILCPNQHTRPDWIREHDFLRALQSIEPADTDIRVTTADLE